MKIFEYIALAGFAAASTELSLSGNENPDELMDILNRLSGKFKLFIYNVEKRIYNGCDQTV